MTNYIALHGIIDAVVHIIIKNGIFNSSVAAEHLQRCRTGSASMQNAQMKT